MANIDTNELDIGLGEEKREKRSFEKKKAQLPRLPGTLSTPLQFGDIEEGQGEGGGGGKMGRRGVGKLEKREDGEMGSW